MPKPNLILVHTDQHRADCLSYHGHPDLMTPNLDQLACSGANFRQAYTPSPICCSARRSIMTGHSPASDGCLSNAPVRIPNPDETLPALLKRAGYQTADIGRGMHQYPDAARYGFEVRERTPFDSHDSKVHTEIPTASLKGNFRNWPHLLNHGQSVDGYGARAWPYSEDFHHTTWSVNKAIEYLDRRDEEQPFFMSLGFVAPHPPLVPPGFYYDRYRRMDLRAPFVGDWATEPKNNARGLGALSSWIPLGGEEIRSTMAGYYGMINHIDDMLFNFFARVNMCAQPTYILFCSDHGEQLGDHHMFRKCRPYQGSIHVPFMLKGPDIPKGVEVNEPVTLEDILPTFCELAGVEVPTHVEGHSLLPLLSDGTPKDWRHYTHIEQGASAPQAFHCVTDGEWKYIWFSDTGKEQFFHLAKDPHELRDLASETEQAEKLETWRHRLVGHLRDRPEGFVSGQELVAGRTHADVLPHAVPV